MALVLVIDDDPAMHALVPAMLRPPVYSVVMARTALHGLELARSGNPDVILLDLNMPEMNGFTALQKLHLDEKTADIPVLVMTAVREKEAIVRAMRLGARAYIAKPFTMDTLVQKVAEAAKFRATAPGSRSSSELQRSYDQTTIILRNSLRAAIAEVIPVISDGFLQRIRNDAVILDVSRLPRLDAQETPLLDGLLDRLGAERCVLLSGRHTGVFLAASKHADVTPCFITHSDLDEFLQAKEKGGPTQGPAL
jgi:CheY-like chemotaxis protein